MQKPTESKIKITTKQHHEFTFNGVTKKRSIDGRDTVYIVEENLDTFTIESSNTKITEEQTMLYIAICLLSLDPKLGLSFEIVFDSGSMAGVSVMQRDGILESVKLKYDDNKRKEICFILGVPKRTGTNEYNMSNHRVPVAVYALEKAFKMYDMEQPQNDFVAVIEKVENTDLVVTTVEPLPGVVDAPIKTEKSEMIESKPKTDEYQQLLDDIEKVIELVSNDKLPYHDRSQKNTVLCVYIDRLSRFAYDADVDAVKSKNIADMEFSRFYDEFLADPKNTGENGRVPSDASAKAHAKKMTLELYLDAKLSEKLGSYLSDRIKTLDRISKSVIQEVSNAKKIEEQARNLK